jgi:hypothetical protein
MANGSAIHSGNCIPKCFARTNRCRSSFRHALLRGRLRGCTSGLWRGCDYLCLRTGRRCSFWFRRKCKSQW